MEVNLFDHLNETLRTAETMGVLLLSIGNEGVPNVMTISWLLLGRIHYERPIAVVAVRSDRYTHRLLDQVEEFVIAVPPYEFKRDVAVCGEKSGREFNKFEITTFTPLHSVHVKPPSIKECHINIECKIYSKIVPPHLILTPEHRKKPISKQHTIYFAEVMGVFKYQP